MADLSLNEAGTASLTAFTSHTSEFKDEEKDETLYEKQKIVAHIVSCILLLMGVYLLTTLCCYECKVYLKNRKQSKISRRTDKLVRDWTSDVMRWLCLLASLISVVRFGLEMVEIWHSQRSNIVCNLLRQIKASLLAASILCLYIVLWCRQRSLYKAPMLKPLSNKAIRFFSKSSIVFLVLATVLTAVLYMFTRGYRPSLRGCLVAWSSVWHILPALLQFLFTLLFQIILVGLLIYPLYQHRVATKSLIQVSQKKTISLVKRITMVTLVSVATDGLAGLIVLLSFSNSFAVLGHVVYDVDLLINIIAVICSFTDWRSRLCPHFAKEKRIKGTVKRRKVENNLTGSAAVSSEV